MSRRLSKRYKALQQVCADICHDCGWAMKFPDIGCVKCFYDKGLKFSTTIEYENPKENMLSQSEATKTCA